MTAATQCGAAQRERRDTASTASPLMSEWMNEWMAFCVPASPRQPHPSTCQSWSGLICVQMGTHTRLGSLLVAFLHCRLYRIWKVRKKIALWRRSWLWHAWFRRVCLSACHEEDTWSKETSPHLSHTQQSFCAFLLLLFLLQTHTHTHSHSGWVSVSAKI